MRWFWQKRVAEAALEAPDPFASFSKGDLSSAVCGVLYGQVHPASFLSRDDGEWLLCADAIARLRQKYATIEPPRVRAEFREWLDYYERRNNEGLRDFRKQKRAAEAVRLIRERNP